MPFEIIRNDITKVAADAIVNTANPEPVIGAGTDTAIHRAAGPKLLDARRRIGAIAVGTSVETPAFDLPAKYVLHTVSPAWEDGEHGEEAGLYAAYAAALALADRLNCRSVAFPLLSAGSYGFPQEVALGTAIRACTDFLMTHDLDVILVLFGEAPFSLAKGLFGDLKAYVDDRYVGEAETAEYDVPETNAYAKAERCESDFAARPELRPAAAAPRRTDAIREKRRRNARFAAAKAEQAPAPQATDLETILRGAENTFSEHVLDLLRECGERDADVYHRAQISRQLFHKIISSRDYQPTKSTAVQLAIGLRLSLAETQKLLYKAGYSLTRSSKADLVVQYFIERGCYSIVEINLALYDCGLPLLKTGSAA